ncbi:hypothetical protein [Nocardia nepalensis]
MSTKLTLGVCTPLVRARRLARSAAGVGDRLAMDAAVGLPRALDPAAGAG